MKYLLVLSVLFVGISLSTSTALRAQSSDAAGPWRGFMGVPNGEEFGFTLDVETNGDGISGVLIPDPVPNDVFRAFGLRITEDVVSFRWEPSSFAVQCTMQREADGTYFGACVEPRGGLAPAVIAPPGRNVSQDRLSWERLRTARDKAQAREILDNVPGPRGEKIDVGGYGLYTLEEGSGRPTVVFVSGLGDDLRTWDYVHYDVQEFARAVSYSRSGLGYSDDGLENPSLRDLADELHSLLQKIDAEGPYVLVAHRFGSFVARAYAAAHPGKVSGLVLVDPLDEQEGRRYAELDAGSWNDYLERQATLYALAPDAVGEEFAIVREALNRGTLDGIGLLPDVPTVIVTPIRAPEETRWVGETPEGRRARQDLQENMLNGLSWSRYMSAEKSVSYVHREEPDLVVEAVHAVIDASRSDQSRTK